MVIGFGVGCGGEKIGGKFCIRSWIRRKMIINERRSVEIFCDFKWGYGWFLWGGFIEILNGIIRGRERIIWVILFKVWGVSGAEWYR